MNCYDCGTVGAERVALAVCSDCGAGVCVEHAVNVRQWLTRSALINRVERIEPPARIMRCGTCHAAHAARGDVATTAAPVGAAR